MIEITVDRIRPLIPPERILVITAAPLVPAIRSLLPDIPEENVIGEPIGRNTAPCIAIAARIAEKRWGEDTVLLVKGADYRIGKPGFFLKIVRGAADFAAGGDRVVTLGLTPTRAETGYGYIERKEYAAFERESVSVFPVRSFREKPDAETAQEFCRSGRFYWNSGMFVWTCRTVRKSVRKHAPEISRALDEIEDRLGTAEQDSALENIYPTLPSISIDYAVMEKSDNVYVAPADIEWDDVGSWTALERYEEKDPDGNVITAMHVGIDTRDCIIAGEEGIVATLGVKNLLIVRTGDVVLVADKNRDQEVKQLLSLCEQDPEKKQFT
jgi:mannose-1-phosphate guanylyltransferase